MLAACRRWRAKHSVHSAAFVTVFDHGTHAKCSVSFEADAADTVDAFLRSVGLADGGDVEEFFLEDHDAPTEHGEPEPEADVAREADVDGLEAERVGYIADPEVTPEEDGTGISVCGFDGGEDGCDMTDDEMWVPLYAPALMEALPAPPARAAPAEEAAPAQVAQCDAGTATRSLTRELFARHEEPHELMNLVINPNY